MNVQLEVLRILVHRITVYEQLINTYETKLKQENVEEKRVEILNFIKLQEQRIKDIHYLMKKVLEIILL